MISDDELRKMSRDEIVDYWEKAWRIGLKNIGKRLENYMIKNKLTCHDVALDVGVKVETIKAWRDGLRHPSCRFFKKLKSIGVL